jgi:hypothetical protein
MMYDLTLSSEIKPYFPNHDKFCVQNLLITVWSIFESQTTNLNKAKDKVCRVLGNGSSVDEHANYTRLIRFFKTPDKSGLIASILTLSCVFLRRLPSRQGTQYLILDGTEWSIGGTKVQFLTLCIVWYGVAIPIWWEDLEKFGHSSTQERKSVITNALKRYNLRGMVLLADREYIGEDWFGFLREQGIEFVIRLKSNIYHHYVNATKGWRQSALVRQAQRKERGKWAAKNITIQGWDYEYIVVKNLKHDEKEPLIYLLTSLKKVDKAVAAYGLRWQIETCFKHLKTNGFDLEAMNFKDKLKRELMMAVVVFLYVLAIQEGFFEVKKTKNDSKHYKYYKKSDTSMLAVSYFRKGVSLLSRKIGNFKELVRWITLFLKKAKPPFWSHV